MRKELHEPTAPYARALGVGLIVASLSAEAPTPVPVNERAGQQLAAEPKVIGTGPVRFLPVSPVHQTSGFGPRKDPLTGQRAFHAGVDLGAPFGTPVYSVGEGVVVDASVRRGYGLSVQLDLGEGWTSLYAHLSEISVSVGERVSAGQPIGKVGLSGKSTGPHLHYELLHDGKAVDPRCCF